MVVRLGIDTNTSLTPYRDVNLFLQVLLDNVRTVLGEYFCGMYLYGSLAIGDFEPSRSDIDVLVVTNGVLPDRLILDLKSLHVRLYESSLEWATKLEGAYIPMDAIRRYNPTGPACPLVNRSEFLVAVPESNWVINRYVLYTCGVVVTGPPLKTIIDPVQPEQLREAVMTLLHNNWTPWLRNSDLFLSVDYAQPYVVLNMCRSLYILVHGTVVSKQRSAEWVTDNCDVAWAKLVKQAIAWHYGDPPGDISMTQKFMRYVFDRAGLKTKPIRS
jgi:predicted nucleotidyltransferase